MNYIAQIEHRVSGIPCLIGVVSHESVRGSMSYSASSDLDYYGYSESAFHVLDRRGRRAEWLERKLNAKQEQEVCALINDRLE